MAKIEWKAELFTNPKKGKKVFDALVQMLETQQSQIETLADERKWLEERIKVQHKRWVFDVRSLEDQIDQMREQMKSSEMACLVEATRTNLVLGLKKKQDLLYKLKLEHLEDELVDFRDWFDILSHRCPTSKDIAPKQLHDIVEERDEENGSSKAANTKKVDCNALEDEIKRLKREYEKLSIKNSSDLFALLSEKEFVWNQYREMESKYTTELQVKNDEVNQANARVTKLLDTLEQLQSLSKEKDSQIAELKANLAKMEAATVKKEIMSDEIESLKESKSDLRTPALRRCTAQSKATSLGSDDRKTTSILKGKVSSSQGSRGDKRKRVAFGEETPKLFTSGFKIPKLKSSSLR